MMNFNLLRVTLDEYDVALSLDTVSQFRPFTDCPNEQGPAPRTGPCSLPVGSQSRGGSAASLSQLR
jgi:hypothetical protein